MTKAAYNILEFCQAHGFSRGTYYNLKKVGKAPREMRVLDRVLITDEAAAEWRREREAESRRTAEMGAA